MLVLGVTTVGDTAWARVLETLIGAVVGLAFNLLLAPPVWVEEAGESIEDLARRMRQLMLRMGEEAAGRTPGGARGGPAARGAPARPRHRRGGRGPQAGRGQPAAQPARAGGPAAPGGAAHRAGHAGDLHGRPAGAGPHPHRPRQGARARAAVRGRDGRRLEQLLSEIADAVVSFAVLVTTARQRERRVRRRTGSPPSCAQAAAHPRQAGPAAAARRSERDARHWQLHGAVLTEVNRILDELDTEHRSRRLLEELDRVHPRAARAHAPADATARAAAHPATGCGGTAPASPGVLVTEDVGRWPAHGYEGSGPMADTTVRIDGNTLRLPGGVRCGSSAPCGCRRRARIRCRPAWATSRCGGSRTTADRCPRSGGRAAV